MKKAGDYIKNPKTGRAVKVGGRVYMTLIRDGLIEGKYEDDNEVYELKEEEYEDDDKIDQYIQFSCFT